MTSWWNSRSLKRLIAVGLILTGGLVVLSSPLLAKPKSGTPAERCAEWMGWANPHTQALLNEFNRNNPNAAFSFLFRKLDDSVYQFFNKQLHLQGAGYPPLPSLPEILNVFKIEESNEVERYKLQLAFEALLVLLQKPNAEELMLEIPGLFSSEAHIAKVEKKAFQEIAHFVKVRLRGVSPGDPKLAAFLFLSKYNYKPLGLPLPWRKRMSRALVNAPRNLGLFVLRNSFQPGYGFGNLRYELFTQWRMLRRFKPWATRAAFAKEAEVLLNLRKTLREPHDDKPTFMTRKPRIYHLNAISKINDIISQPSGRELPLLPELRDILTEKPDLESKSKEVSSEDDWTHQVNAAGRTWTIDTLTNFAHYVEDLMAKAKDERKLEALSKKDLFIYLLEFMTPARITALVRGIEAAHKEQNEFLDSKRGEIENVLLHLQTNFDRYRSIPGLLAKNEKDKVALEQRIAEGINIDANELSRIDEEERSLKLEQIEKAEILAGLYIKAIVITEHFHLQMDPVFDDLYRSDNLFRFMVKRLIDRAQAENESMSSKEREKVRENFVNNHGSLVTDYLSGSKDPDVLLAQSARGLYSAGFFSKIPVLRDIGPAIMMFGVPILSGYQLYQNSLRQDDLTKSTPWVISSDEKYVSDAEEFKKGKYSLFIAKWSVSPPTKVEVQALELIWDQLLESDVPLELREKWAELTAEKAPFYYGDGKLENLASSGEKWREAFNKPGSDLKDLLDWTIRFNWIKNRKLYGDTQLEGQSGTPISMAIPPPNPLSPAP